MSGCGRRSVAKVSRELRVVRFGDNMREVAVTEGDKVEAQIKLGWQVNTWPVGELAAEIEQGDRGRGRSAWLPSMLRSTPGDRRARAVRYQARQQIAMERILVREGAGAYTNTFEDLWGMEQLPGLATQDLMAKGYGYGAEGDWKTAAMTRIVKQMTQGLDGGTSFMEDYTYHFEPGNEYVLGAHMLEVCPTIASEKPRVEVHPLGIGGKDAPARLVFDGRAGDALVISLIDMGGRLRLIVQEVECVKPDLRHAQPPGGPGDVAAQGGLGGRHTPMDTARAGRITRCSRTPRRRECSTDWADIMGIESVHLAADTRSDELKGRLELADVLWKLRSL